MIKVSVIGNHEKIKHYLGVWLKVFGFEVTDTAPHFTIEVLTSDSNVITHSNQSELAGLIRSLVYDFGIYIRGCQRCKTRRKGRFRRFSVFRFM